MKVYVVLVYVCFSLFFQIRFCSAGRKGFGSSSLRDNWRPQVGLDTDLCQAQGREIRTLKNKIIRTKDSIDNGACFADAIVVTSIDECSSRCCSYTGDDCNAKCDTSIFVHETGDNNNSEEVNCFLFVCGDGDDCRFSYHNGYTTTMIFSRQERKEHTVTTTRPTFTTTTAARQTTFNRPVPSPTTATWDIPTTKKQENNHKPNEKASIDGTYEEKPDEISSNHNSHGCGHFRFECGSGECFKFAFVCDGVIDCRDNSDETGCDYTTTVEPLITTSTTTSAPDTRVWPTHQNPANNKPNTQQFADLRTHSAAEGQTASMAGSSSPEVASGSKKDFLSKHVVGEEIREGSEKVVGNDQASGASGRVSDSDDQVGYKVHAADGGLTQELHNKGQEKMNGAEEIQGHGLSLTDLQDDLNALSGTGNDKDGNVEDQDSDKEYTGVGGGTYNGKVEGKDRSGEYVNDNNEDYDSNGGGMWSYNDDRDKEKQQLPQDLYGTKFEEEHEANRKDEDSLKEIGRGKKEKDKLDLDYTFETSVGDQGKPNGYERNPNDGHKKEGTPDATREDSSSIETDNMNYNQDDHLNGRPVYQPMGRKLDNVQHIPHTRKNGHQHQIKNEEFQRNGMNHQMKSSDHTINGRLESTQINDKGAHSELSPVMWQEDRTKDGWDGRSFAGESRDADDDNDKGLVRDKGDRWLQQGPKGDQKEDETFGGEYFNRNQGDNSPDSGWPDTDVVSRNRNLGWPENMHDGRQRNEMKDDRGHVPPSRIENTGAAEYEPDRDIPSQNYGSKWQNRQRRPDPAPNQVYLPKYHRQQAHNWYNNPNRKAEYRDYEDLGRGENAHQFWNQYKNEQIQHHRSGGNNAGLSQDYSADDYGNVGSFDNQNHEDMNEMSTAEPPQENDQVGSSSIMPTTTTKSNENSSDNSFTQLPGNVTETPKKTIPNSSNKNGSSRKTLFKKKSSLPDKSLTSAILPLAFGLLITVLLLLLVGCRLRQVNRRLRYGRLKTNVAEADYLINGMYL